jgi:hypothetical protein
VVGNLIFASTAIDGPVATQHDNIVDMMGNAAMYVNSPSFTLGAMDFYPKAGKATGAPMDLSPAAMDTAYDRDFNGTSKDKFTFRGAYAGEGANPGWPLGDGVKMGSSGTGGSGAGGGGSGGEGSGGKDGSGGTGGGGTSAKSGCGCEVAGGGERGEAIGGSWVLAAVIAELARRRRGRAAARPR